MIEDRMDAIHMNPVWGEYTASQANKGQGDKYYKDGVLVEQKPEGY